MTSSGLGLSRHFSTCKLQGVSLNKGDSNSKAGVVGITRR